MHVQHVWHRHARSARLAQTCSDFILADAGPESRLHQIFRNRALW